MPFDIEGARKAGIPDDQIMAELVSANPKFDINGARKAGIPDDDIMKELSSGPPPEAAPSKPSPESQGLLAKLKGRLGEMGKIYDYTQNPATTSPMRRIINAPGSALMDLGQIGGGVGDVIGSAIGTLMTDEKKKQLTDLISNVSQSKFGKAVAGTADELKERYPIGTKMSGDMLNAAALLPMGKLAKMGADVGLEPTINAAKYAKNIIKPAPTAEEALGQILQGKSSTLTKDYVKGGKALSAVDTEGVKTYADLSGKLNESIPKYAKMVDEELAKDPKLYKLDELSKSVGDVKQNFVEKALNHLQELYTKIEDPVRAKQVEAVLNKANTTGLSKVEINNIARQYNSEFDSKAFSKITGEPLTSVNAQAYENIRKGVKDTARQGMGDSAKELDDTLSSIYNTKRLVDKNVEAVNTLKQKVDARGLGTKIGRGLLDAMDIATLGIGKGMLLKLKPRGFGFKVKNSLDLEEALSRNLKIVNEALAAKGDQQIINTINKLNSRKALMPGNPSEGDLNNVPIPRKEVNNVRGTETGSIGKPYDTEPPLKPQPALRDWNPYSVTDERGIPSRSQAEINKQRLIESIKTKQKFTPESSLPSSKRSYGYQPNRVIDISPNEGVTVKPKANLTAEQIAEILRKLKGGR